MTTRYKALRGSMLLTAGEAVVYGASFVRNMILARMLTKADFGITAIFAMTISLLEFSAKLGVPSFVVRDRDGDRAGLVSTAHLVQFIAAVSSAMFIVAAGEPMMRLFGLRDQGRSVMLLALIPLLRGLQHLDISRLERDLRFGPATVVMAVPQMVATLAAWAVAVYFRDYRAVLVLMLGQTVMGCIVSHCLAKNPYRWGFERAYVDRILQFGWPLVVSGLLMFGVMQGGQFLVGAFYSMAELGPYAAAAALAMAPVFIFSRVFHSVMLPLMARVQDDAGEFERRYRQAMAVISAFSAMYAVGLVIGAEPLMRLAYGAKYAGSGMILAWLAAGNAFRCIRTAPALAAMSKGDSKNQMIAGIWRVVALVPAAGVVVMRQPVWMVAATGLLGEVLACGASFVRLRRRDGIALSISLTPSVFVALATAGGFAVGSLGVHRWNPYLACAFAAVVAMVTGLGLLLSAPGFIRKALSMIRKYDAPGRLLACMGGDLL